jgi:AhpD family alkylhydroperoxidase
MLRNLMVAVLSLMSFSTLAAEPNEPPQATYAELKQTFGAVLTPIRVTPDDSAGVVWAEMKSLELNPNTALNGKQKELIGLAVAAQIPCQYCSYVHTEAAKLNGASARDLKEAIFVSATVRHWATFIDGQTDDAAPKQGAVSPEVEAVYQDVAKTMGSVPPFIKHFPMSSVGAAWKMYKQALNGTEGSTLSPKDRALIAIAVSASVPSVPCVKSYKGLAKMVGATDQEIDEALAMSSLTRAGSTILNGNLVDAAAFRAEIDAAFKFVKKNMKKETASR